MALLIFQDAEKARDVVCAEDQKKIRQLYEDWAEEVGQRAKYYAGKTTASSYWQEQQMLELQRQLTEQSKVIANQIYTGTKESLYTVADSVVGCNAKFLADLGFSKDGLQAAFSDVPAQIVNSIVTGQIYQGGWNLSSAIWGDNEKTLSDIYQIVAQGRAMNMSAYDVSKLLEQYVNPNKAKQWNLVMGDGRRIYKKSVDYNAQRLVRTLTQHAYQQGIIQMAKSNPFVQSIIWHSNGSRVCELCQSRDGNEYQANNLPMDHPNGMCVMEPKVDMDSAVDQLADWFNSPDGTYPEIDEFAKNFGYEASKQSGNALSSKQFYEFVSQNNSTILYRGYAGESEKVVNDIHNSIIQGKARVSGEESSALGKGLYFTSNKEEAIQYMQRRMQESNINAGKVEEIVLKPDAKIVSYSELVKQRQEFLSGTSDKLFDIEDKFGRESNEFKSAKSEYDFVRKSDISEFALKEGYDVIYDSATDYYVIINQNKIFVKK